MPAGPVNLEVLGVTLRIHDDLILPYPLLRMAAKSSATRAYNMIMSRFETGEYLTPSPPYSGNPLHLPMYDREPGRRGQIMKDYFARVFSIVSQAKFGETEAFTEMAFYQWDSNLTQKRKRAIAAEATGARIGNWGQESLRDSYKQYDKQKEYAQLPGGYRQFRQIVGRQVGFVDMQLTGVMVDDLVVSYDLGRKQKGSVRTFQMGKSLTGGGLFSGNLPLPYTFIIRCGFKTRRSAEIASFHHRGDGHVPIRAFARWNAHERQLITSIAEARMYQAHRRGIVGQDPTTGRFTSMRLAKRGVIEGAQNIFRV